MATKSLTVVIKSSRVACSLAFLEAFEWFIIDAETVRANVDSYQTHGI